MTALYGDFLPWLLPMVIAPYHDYSIVTAPYHDCSCYDPDCSTMPVPYYDYDSSYHCSFLLWLVFKLLLPAMTTLYCDCSLPWLLPTTTAPHDERSLLSLPYYDCSYHDCSYHYCILWWLIPKLYWDCSLPLLFPTMIAPYHDCFPS